MSENLNRPWSLKHLWQGDLAEVLGLPGVAVQLSRSQGDLSYRCAIAFSLGKAGGNHLSAPSTIATKIASQLPQYQLEVVADGLLIWRVPAQQMARWLAQFSPLITLQPGTTNELRDDLFKIQYAHARCCALLGWAEQLNLATVSPQFQITSPIPWLIAGQLFCQHPAEFRLLHQLVTTVDQWPADWLTLGHRLSTAWEEFFTHCRIFDPTLPRDLVLARLGAIAITRWLLQGCLANLGAAIPQEI